MRLSGIGARLLGALFGLGLTFNALAGTSPEMDAKAALIAKLLADAQARLDAAKGVLGGSTTTTPPGGTTTTPPPPPVVPDLTITGSTAMVVGMNMSRHTYYSTDWAFADAFKHSGGWAERGTHYPTLNLDVNGWPLLQPGQAAQTPIFRSIQGHYPGGEWVMKYDGEGTFVLYYDCVKVSEKPGELRFKVNRSDLGMLIQVSSSNPKNPVRNMRLMYPDLPVGYTGTFHPKFLAAARPFPVIRFMEWQMTNYAKPVAWTQRALPNQAIQTSDWGVALEYIIQYCNETQTDPWLSIPHTASDDYVKQMATLVRDKLDKKRKVYVEWSNEAWNWIYPQGVWCVDEARKRGLSYPQVMADEARHDFATWRAVFAGQESRMVRVAAGQHYNPWVLQTMLARMNGEFDAISCGGYFFPSDASISLFNSTTTPAQIIAACSKEMDKSYFVNLGAHRAMADQYSASLKRSIPLLVYEGGQHLAPSPDKVWFKAAQAAQKDPAMGALYDKMIVGAKAQKVNLFMAYNLLEQPSQYGSFGHLEYQDQVTTTSPKYTTLLKYTLRK